MKLSLLIRQAADTEGNVDQRLPLAKREEPSERIFNESKYLLA